MKPPNLRISENNAERCGTCQQFYQTVTGAQNGGECTRYTERSYAPELVRADFACDSFQSSREGDEQETRTFLAEERDY